MLIIENKNTGSIFQGQELEYMVDDDVMIGEVYLDGNLIYQFDDVIDEHFLKDEFKSEFKIIRSDEDEDIFEDEPAGFEY